MINDYEVLLSLGYGPKLKTKKKKFSYSKDEFVLPYYGSIIFITITGI